MEVTKDKNRMHHRINDGTTIAHGASVKADVQPQRDGEQKEDKNGVVEKLRTEPAATELSNTSRCNDGGDDGYHGPFFGF